MREKMIDIVLQTPCVAVSSRTAAGKIVDNLIANGMTIQPQTNADRIRAMSDEELADFITDKEKGWCTDIGREMYYQHNLEWLKQPAVGE